MGDPSPAPNSAMPPQLLLQYQGQRQQEQQIRLIQQYQRQLLMQQQRSNHHQQSQDVQPQLGHPHQLHDPRQQRDRDQRKQLEQEQEQQRRHFQQSQQQLLAMSEFPSNTNTNTNTDPVSSVVQSIQKHQFAPPPVAPQQQHHHPQQGVGAGGALESAALKLSKSLEVDTVVKDAWMVCNPDIKKPFLSVEDAVQRLLPYHIFADYEAEEDDKILSDKNTEQVPSRLQQWDQNILTKMEDFTSAFEKLVQDFNIMTQKTAVGEFRTEERLMIERTLLLEERRAMLQLGAQLQLRGKLERELTEGNLRTANAAGQARAEVTAVSNRVNESSLIRGLDPFGQHVAIADWAGNAECGVQSLSYSRGRVSNPHMAVAQTDHTWAMVSSPASAMVNANPGPVLGSGIFGQACESIVGWNGFSQGEHKDLSLTENEEPTASALLGRWRDAGMLNKN